MEGIPRTHESDVLQYCIIAIETAARKMGIAPSELIERLEKQGLIDSHLIGYYDTLHTQSAEYIADDIIETLYNYEHDQWRQHPLSWGDCSGQGRSDLTILKDYIL